MAGDGLAASPSRQRADRGIDLRLEGIRARADARRPRQRGGGVLDRELRPDGRAHRRLGHRRAGDDADRPRVPDGCATSASPILREVGVDTGGCNIQFAINPADGRLIVIEMNPRVSRSSGAGVQGHRLPDRQDRRQAGHRLHPRRDRQRHHQGNPGLLRADAGLRRRQGAAVRVREVPRRRPDADHHDEVRRRGDVVGPQLHRGARQGDAVAGDRVVPGSGPARTPRATSHDCWTGCRPRPTAGSTTSSSRCGSARRVEEVAAGLRRRPVVRRADQRAGGAAGRTARRPGARRGAAAPQQAQRPVGPPDRRAATGTGRRGRCPGAAPTARHPPGVQDRRHLRGRVRGQDAVPLQQLRARPRRRDRGGAADREAQGAHPGLRTEPHRPGHRVRLQLRARRDHVVARPDSRP